MKVEEIVKAIENLSATQLAELCDSLKTIFGIDDSMLAVGVSAGGSSVASSEDDSAPVSFKVVMNNVEADKKNNLIKEIKTILGIGLGEAKTMVDKAAAGEEVVVKTSIPKAEADDLCKKLQSAGGSLSVSAA